MYDSLNKIGLKTVLEAIKDKMPTSLPANGGNADTVGGKVPEKIFYDNGLSADLNGATQSGCYATSPDTLNVPFSAWWLVDTMNFNNQFIVQKAHNIGSPTNTVSYIRNYANDVWSEWKEISTTPIKSTTFSGTTNDYGGLLWISASAGKVPLFVDVESKYVIPFRFVGNYWFYMTHATVANHAQPAANVAATGTVYYVEI